MSFSESDLDELCYAKSLLESPGLAAKLINLIGMPIEKAFDLLPEKWSEVVTGATKKALDTALRVALVTLDDSGKRRSRDVLHKALVTATGAGGGFAGLAGLPVELPLSTTIILRSIADIARSEGEQLRTPEAKLACLEVFAFGGYANSDDSVDSAYFAVRAGLAKALSEAAEYIAQKGLAQEAAPPLVRFLATIGARFGVNVSEKAAAQAIPVLGAGGGAVINLLFIDHFQDMARGHFIVRKLERRYGSVLVETTYLSLE
jgi:hypothetical protein